MNAVKGSGNKTKQLRETFMTFLLLTMTWTFVFVVNSKEERLLHLSGKSVLEKASGEAIGAGRARERTTMEEEDSGTTMTRTATLSTTTTSTGNATLSNSSSFVRPSTPKENQQAIIIIDNVTKEKVTDAAVTPRLTDDADANDSTSLTASAPSLPLDFVIMGHAKTGTTFLKN